MSLSGFYAGQTSRSLHSENDKLLLFALALNERLRSARTLSATPETGMLPEPFVLEMISREMLSKLKRDDPYPAGRPG